MKRNMNAKDEPDTGTALAVTLAVQWRATVGASVLCKGDSFIGWRPADYLTAGVLLGTVGTIALAALSRSRLRRSGDGPGAAAVEAPERTSRRMHDSATASCCCVRARS